MKKIFKITSLFIAFTAAVACDDFTDVAPIGPVSNDYFNTQEEYENALIGAYDMLQATFWNVLTATIASDDIVAGGDAGNYDQPTLQDVDQMIHNQSSNVQLRDVWQLMYAGMNRANFILEFKNKTAFEGKDEIIAQAYFLRAYYAFELAKWYGDIPLLTEERSGTLRIADKRILFGDQYNVDRVGSIAKVYSLIEEDLKEAIPNLPKNQELDYEVTKGAAQALLGKVYLYHASFDDEKFALAANALDEVINSGEYSLAKGTDFQEMWDLDGENGSGSVFEIQYTSVEGAGWGCIICSEGNYIPKFTAPRSPYNGDKYIAGWGFVLPTPMLVDAFQAGDLRKEISILDMSGVSYTESRGSTGYFNKKYIGTKENDASRTGSDPLNYTNNYRAIRFADVLLMSAEAHAQSGGTKAADYLNDVRERAFGNNSKDYTAGEGTLLDAIYKERRIELSGEGHRFFDLVRTNKAKAAFDTFNAWVATQDEEIGHMPVQFSENKNELFPIPLVELELANAVERWGQNKGY